MVSYMLKNLGKSLEEALGQRKTGDSASSMGESMKKQRERRAGGKTSLPWN